MSSPDAIAAQATVHLVRHGEVENPKGVVYGRMPGYNLSERGRRQAAEAARRLKDARVGTVWASPLERAQETAQIIAELHGLEIVTDERLTESDTTLEGATRKIAGLVRTPRHWWSFRNPLRPSWGESFSEVGARMVSAVHDAVAQADGQDVVVVSHQTPVRVARLALGRRRIPPWLPLTRCSTGSVTTLVLDGDSVVSASYFEPSER
jgi:broad specificity phosphatase PhoE